MVIEFDRNEKRIVVSHTRIWEQAKIEEKEAAKKEARAEADKTKKAVKTYKAKLKKLHWVTWVHWLKSKPN